MRERTKISGGEVAWEQQGEGEPLLLLHGWLRAAQEWSSLLPHISRFGRVISMDYPGHGESEVTPGGYDIPFLVRRAMGLVDHLGIKSFIPVGHGVGGAVALQLGHEQPERVRKMVLISPSTWPNPVYNRRAALIRGPLGRLYFEYVFDRERCRNMLLRRHYADPSRVDEALLDCVYTPWRRPGSREVLHRSLAPAFNPRITLQLETVKAKTLALWGQKDVVHSAAMGERLVREKPNTELEVLPGGDYMIQETASEWVAQRIGSWLER